MNVEALSVFLKVADLGSFTRAAEQLGTPKSRVSLLVKTLESEIGAHLLQRTTRAVRLTPDGEQFAVRARALVHDADELSSMFQATSSLSGRVRIDLSIAFARRIVIPRLPEFLALHPQLEMVVSTTDRRVELVREAFDCVLRIGMLDDSSLVARKLGTLAMVNVASPSYLRKFGVPKKVADLDRHQLVHYSLSLGGDQPSFEYKKGSRWVSQRMKSSITVNNTDAYSSACLAGLGIIQVPRIGTQDAIREGSLVEILPQHTCEPMPVSLIHTHGREVPLRVRTVMDWLASVVRLALVSPASMGGFTQLSVLDRNHILF